MTPIRPEPRAFGPPDRPLFGWLHAPPAGVQRRNVGLVICKPFGYEAICAHRALRHFADAAAAAGIPALRFDYDGTGDSAGDDRDPARWPAWVKSVHHAVDELRRDQELNRVMLLGVRLGAMLAATTAAERSDIAGLVAIVPVLSGRAWLREANALEIAMRFQGPPPGLEPPAGEQESVGFVITAETKAALQGANLLEIQRPAPSVLLLDRDDLPSNTKWVDHLTAAGAVVDHKRVPGYPEMMLDPHESILPEAMLEEVSSWLVGQSSPRTTAVAERAPRTEVGPLRVMPGVEEVAGWTGTNGNLFGVVSLPAAAPVPGRAVVLLNAGAITHIGPSRLYVDLARRWAARGWLVFRFDQAGIGDSTPFPGERENVVYAPTAVEGVRQALDHLRARWGVSEIQAVGLCSGAYHAFKAAVAGLPLTGIAVVNPLVFFWRPGMSLAYPAYQVSEATARYKQSILDPAKWRKLLAGKVNIRDFAQIVAQRASINLSALARDLARAAGRPMSADLGGELATVVRRGTRLRFVFATGDPGEDLLRSQAGRSVRRLERERSLRISRIDGPNHSFTPVWTRVALTEVLERELDLR